MRERHGLLQVAVAALLAISAPSAAAAPAPSRSAAGAALVVAGARSGEPASGQRRGGARVLFVLLGGASVGGGIGCGDRLMAVPVPVPEGGDPLRVAIEALLTSRQRLAERAGLYNAFARSRLRIEELRVEGGVVTLHLSGELRLGGDCDAPRVRAQLERTALQLPGVRELHVTIDGVPLAELLSSH